jgi:hypothetical protein
MIDVIRLDVPTFIRLLELAREEIDNDMDLHDVAEKMTELSQGKVVTMADYDEVVGFMQKQGDDEADGEDDDAEFTQELENMRRFIGGQRGS